MNRIIGKIFAVALGSAIALPAGAQGVSGSLAAPVLITAAVDKAQLVTLAGNTRPEANAQNDQGPVPDDFALPDMLLQLNRSSAQEQALETLIDQLHDSQSSNFHKWLTPTEIGAQFGPAAADVQKIIAWLTGEGFTVNSVYPSGMLIDFSGTAGQVRTAFHTSIDNLLVAGEAHFANMTDPQIPAALAPAVEGVVSLHDFRPHPQYARNPNYTFQNGECVDKSNKPTKCYAVTPPDLETIYNINPLIVGGVSGEGQTIYLIEDTNLFTNKDWTTFRSAFGLSGFTKATLTTTHPKASGGSTCDNPGTNGDDGEAIIDAEYASASAPNAAIVMATCASSATTDGVIFAIENLINGDLSPTLISMSYGECETLSGQALNKALNKAYQQGVAEGISIFVAAGDQEASGCNRASTAKDGIGVSGWASSPYDVAVGGTDFSDTLSGTNTTYWTAGNNSSLGSAKSYIPEIPWNTTCASELFAAFEGFATTYGAKGLCNSSIATANGGFYQENWGGSGGPSACATGSPSVTGVVGGSCAGWPKPSYQAGVIGVPNDGVRDLPDVSLFASFGPWNHFFVLCWSDPSFTRDGSAPCTGTPDHWSTGFGGTSFASPIMAGIQALVNENSGEAQGNPNGAYYRIAAAEYGASGNSACNSSQGNAVASSCIFYDITQGDNDSPCKANKDGKLYDCFDPSGAIGVLSTSNKSYQPAYPTGVGWDFATGLGSVNAYNLVVGWNTGMSFALSVSTVGKGKVKSSPAGIECGATCSASFAAGTEVDLSATPDSGWQFDEWSGACAGKKEGVCHVTMNAAESVMAKFTKK